MQHARMRVRRSVLPTLLALLACGQPGFAGSEVKGGAGMAAGGDRVFTVIDKRLDLSASEVLYRFDRFDPADWQTVRGTPRWQVLPGKIVGGGPDEPTHGQIFFREPVVGDVVMEFDARIVPPSYHDLVWFWNVDLGEKRGERDTWDALAAGGPTVPGSRSSPGSRLRRSRHRSARNPARRTTSSPARSRVRIS